MSDILFADDDAALRQMVAEVLRAAGHGVRLAANGAEALAEVRRLPPDLVILDYRMGEPDGFTVCRRIKSDPGVAHLPVLILTAQDEMENRLHGFDAGADDYLVKPFDPRELAARITALLRQARRGRDRNPTTGLPGGEAITDEFDRRRGLGDAFDVCYFDLDDFKPFSDRFGFAVADRAIRAVGRVLTALSDPPGTFVGHVGGDDFVLVCPAGLGAELARAARDGFAAALRAELPDDVVRSGTYRGRDRAGEVREFPVTRLSAAVVRIDPARWTSLEHLGERVAEAKRRAKDPAGPGIVQTRLEPTTEP